MAIEQSILNGTKKKLGLDENYDAFDTDVIDYINSSFFRLKTLGLGPPDGFVIEDATETWDDFDMIGLDKTVINAVKTYINLKVKLIFDPPGTPHHISAINEQIQELEHVMLTERNLVYWSPPDSPFDSQVVLDGGVG